MADAVVHVRGRPDPLAIRINGPDPTFYLGTDKLKAQLLGEIAPRFNDFLEIASTVFAADGTVRRGGDARAGMGTAWRRGFRFRIPVRDPEFWSDPKVSDLLVETASFLTDDDYSFDFVGLETSTLREPYLDLDPHGALFPADNVILFSGGLDSYSGALDILENTERKVVLVSHRSAQKVIPRQVALGEYLADRFPDRVKHLHLVARRKGPESKDTTQRSRTLLFTAIGATVCQAFEASRINFFENGIVSHNLPITPQVVGTMATRTTHPLALSMLGRLIGQLSEDGISLSNPFEWSTKAEVVGRIQSNDRGKGALMMIDRAVSCTSVRDQDSLHTHCGECSQCLDRRFAILGLGLERFDPPERYRTDLLGGARHTHKSRVMAVEWTRHAITMAEITERQLVEQFGLETARIAEGFPDLSARDLFGRVIKLHRRHGENVRSVLHHSVDEALLERRPLDPQCLLAMYLSGGDARPVVDNLSSQPPRSLPQADLDTMPEEDLVPDPAAPLTVAFFREHNGNKNTAAIKVAGLCEIRNSPAEVAHRLKPYFDQDRSDGLAEEEFRFTLGPSAWPGCAKNTFRKYVERCRKDISQAFQEIHGEAPDGHLLIQNHQGDGYRLDPAIKVVAKDRLGRAED